MTNLIILISVLLILAAFFNAVMDLSSENLFKKTYWNKDQSWKNKWKLDADGNLMPPYKYWWYFGLYKPPYQERFIYSSTVLVFLTDGWHLMQFFFHLCWQLCISFLFGQYWWIALIPIKIVFNVSFQIIYGNWKKKLSGS